jgi:hypothetical protein
MTHAPKSTPTQPKIKAKVSPIGKEAQQVALKKQIHFGEDWKVFQST